MNEGNIKDIVFEECNVNNVNDEDISTYGGILLIMIKYFWSVVFLKR